MKKTFQPRLRKALSAFLAILMLIGSVPFADLTGLDLSDSPFDTTIKANAFSGAYCKAAAAEWAKRHWNDYNSLILGTGYWDHGGDCANFVSQCLYMGGLDMEQLWHLNGWYCHWNPGPNRHDGSWIRCYQLHNYLLDYGAHEIIAPQAWQVDIGDVLMYYRPDGGEKHTAIVVDKINGIPIVAAHSTGTVRYITYSGKDWRLGFRSDRIRVIKIDGSICINQNPRHFDVYRANNTRYCDPNRSFKSSPNGRHIDYVWANDWLHVVEKTPDGRWGKIFYYGQWGWIKLSPGFRFERHIDSPDVYHLFGPWITEQKANCIQDGIDKRVCRRCGYTETRVTKGGHELGTPPTCTQPGYCKFCGTALSADYPPLGHDYPAVYETVKEPTCLEDGLKRLVCKRDSSHVIEEVIPALGHDYVLSPSPPTCVVSGERIYICSRCGDTYSDGFADPEDAWCEWTTDSGPASYLPANKIQSGVQRRYRDKEFTTSYETGLPGGWTRDDSKTETIYGDWGSYYETTSPPASSDTVDAENNLIKTEWYYYRWGNTNQKIAPDCEPDEDAGHPYYKEFALKVELTQTKWWGRNDGETTDSWHDAYCLDRGGRVLSYTGTRDNPNLDDPNHEHTTETCGAATVFPKAGSCPLNTYRSRTRSKSYLYHFWRWRDWSAWDFTQPASQADREIEERQVYRYDLSALGHDWSQTPIKEFADKENIEIDITGKEEYADCYKEGVRCNRCGAYNEADAQIYSHDFPDWETERDQYVLVSSENGVDVYRAYCRHTVNGEPCHKYIDKTVDECIFEANIVPPTCTDDGYTHHHCIKHNDPTHDFDDNFVPALDHDWNEWETIKVATCTEKGMMKRICKRDPSHIEYNEIDALGHQFPLIKHEETPPTCIKDGNEEYYYCERCREFFSDPEGVNKIEENSWTLPALGHADPSEVEWELAIPNGCGVTGLERKYCNHIINGEECRAVIAEREIPEIPPDYYVAYAENAEFVDGEWVPTRCDEDGLLYITCRNCEHTEHAHSYLPDVVYAAENIGRLPHIESAPIIDREAYCIYPGGQHIVCERCGQLLDEQIIPAPCTEHNLVECEDTNGGCIYKKCINAPCTYIEPGTHDFQRDPARDVAPTCLEEGLEAYTCTKCGRYKDEILEPTGHNHVLIEEVEGKCTTPGYKVYECHNPLNGGICGDKIIEYDKNPLGHSLLRIDRVEPSCTEDGNIEYYACQRDGCGKIFLDAEGIVEAREEDIKLPALGHDWGEWEVVTPATYLVKGQDKQVCRRDSSHVKYRDTFASKPPLPSEENDNIKTEKTAVYDADTGEALINLKASAKGKTIVTSSKTPLDVALVLDQSGSMEGDKLMKLKEAVSQFTAYIFNDAIENDVDHRIAMVGFAMQESYNFGPEFPRYLNTEILTTGGDPVAYSETSSEEMKDVYKNALVFVNSGGEINADIKTAVNNLDAKGATAVDLGLEMACQIFANNENDGGRKRIVLLMTDGVPTYKSDYMSTTANNAIAKAKLLKNTYGADLYGVGVLLNNDDKAIEFLKNVASKDGENNKLYYDCLEVDTLAERFETIATLSTTTTTDFDDITLVDTLSSAFTFTSVQENNMRLSAVETLGVDAEDVAVTRFADGSTEIEIKHISPKKVESGGESYYVVEFSFSASANENALIQGPYKTNTENAGVIIGDGGVYENNFISPTVNAESAEGAVYFTVNDIPYQVIRLHTGESLEAPEFTLEGDYTFSGWDIPDEITFEGGKLTIDAELARTAYTIKWNIDGAASVDNYYAGDFILPPEVPLNSAGDEFASWNEDVPRLMPAENLEFTARYKPHVHSYTREITFNGGCVSESVATYTCACGDSYTEVIPAAGHKWTVNAQAHDDGSNSHNARIYCENCGASPDETLSYKLSRKLLGKEVVYDVKLVDAVNVETDVDGMISVSLPLPDEMKRARNIKVFREEADGSLSDMNGSVDPSHSYITFVTDHFSLYIIRADYDCETNGKHTDLNNDKICDSCGAEVIEAPTEASGGGGSSSSNCNCLCHKQGKFWRFIWKIILFFSKIFHVNRTCACGAAHY